MLLPWWRQWCNRFEAWHLMVEQKMNNKQSNRAAHTFVLACPLLFRMISFRCTFNISSFVFNRDHHLEYPNLPGAAKQKKKQKKNFANKVSFHSHKNGHFIAVTQFLWVCTMIIIVCSLAPRTLYYIFWCHTRGY